MNSSSSTVKTDARQNSNESSHVLAKAASQLQQQLSMQSQTQTLPQEGSSPLPSGSSFHLLSKRPPIGPPRSGGVSVGASPKQNSSGDMNIEASRHTFVTPQRSFSDMSDPSIVFKSDDAQTPTLPRREEMEANDLTAVIERGNVNRLSVIPSAPPPLTKGNTDAPSFFETSHSRISSLGSTAIPAYPPVEDNASRTSAEDHDHIEEISRTHVMRKKFVAAVTEKSFTALKAGGRTQISIRKNVADLYGLNSYDLVTITKIGENLKAGVLADTQADFVTVSSLVWIC